MKRSVLLYLLIGAGLKLSAQSWTPTHLTNVNYLANTGLESHNNRLYAMVFNGFTANLFRLNTNNTSWDTVPTPGITIPRSLKSIGSRLYMSSLKQDFSSMLYVSTDDGATFTPDTVGLPKFFSGVTTLAGIQSYCNKVIANLASSGYYLKDTGETQWRSVDVPTKLNGGADQLTGLNDSLFAYDNTGTHTLYVSGDYGTTWAVRSGSLASDFTVNLLVSDETTNRLYAAGGRSNGSVTTEYGLYYSDDHGFTWMMTDLSAFIKKNVSNTQQLITALYASGQQVVVALENDRDLSAPDVISTGTGVNGFAYDTLGLPLNGAGALKGLYLVKHNNKVALGLNTTDVYLSGGSGGGVGLWEKNRLNAAGVSLFPNPTSDRFYLHTSEKVSSVTITDALGKTISDITSPVHEIDATAWSPGVYFISIYANGQLLGTRHLVKE